jgi:hypothetical protein
MEMTTAGEGIEILQMAVIVKFVNCVSVRAGVE